MSMIQKFVFILLMLMECCQCMQLIMTRNPPTKVLVTGAGGSVGYHVFAKLLQNENFHPIGQFQLMITLHLCRYHVLVRTLSYFLLVCHTCSLITYMRS
jgi:hypothetical protein